MDLCPVQSESKTLICLTLQKPEISPGFMGHLACKGFSKRIYKCAINTRGKYSRTNGLGYISPTDCITLICTKGNALVIHSSPLWGVVITCLFIYLFI